MKWIDKPQEMKSVFIYQYPSLVLGTCLLRILNQASLMRVHNPF